MALTKKKSAGKRGAPARKKKKPVQTGTSMESEILFMDCSGYFSCTFNQ